MASALQAAYDARVQSGEIAIDPAQAAGLAALVRLEAALASAPATRGLKGLFRKPEAERGVYLWGPVGRGKSMLMDLFFETVAVEKKRRTHFHVFMGEIHRLIDAWRKSDPAARKAHFGQHKGDDPIVPVADVVAEGARLLCFDEFQVTDIADAMILGRLFDRLFAEGVTIVATSNTPPDRLYEGGLNRQLFLPFIEEIKQRLDVLELNGPTDYRLQRLSGLKVYLTPLGHEADAAMNAAWQRLTDSKRGKPASLTVLGRAVPVPQAARGVARFDFADLCAKPLAAADFLAVAREF